MNSQCLMYKHEPYCLKLKSIIDYDDCYRYLHSGLSLLDSCECALFVYSL